MISKVYDGKPKNEFDTYLLGLIETKAIQRRRKRSEESKKPRSSNFSYFILHKSERVPVCKQAFMSIHGVSHIQVQRLTTLLVTEKSPRDLRGLHNNRPQAKSEDVIAKIRDHIESFPLKVSHYSTKTIKYLDARLNAKMMHSLFIRKYPELQGNIKYEYFLRYFKENYNLKFGRPQVDVCSQCEELGAKLRDKNLNDTAKRCAAAELMVHKRRAKKFYMQLKAVEQMCSEQPHVAGIAFDYVQNLPLPHIPVQEIFYYRQLWVYGFEVHNLKDGTAKFYTYHEGQGKKGPDEVCTFLKDYIESNFSEVITELHIFSDGCPGQNKNNTIVRFLLALQASGRFNKICHYFPIRGHSFLPCDRDFGVLKKSIRRFDRVYIPEEYEEIISSCRKNKPFAYQQIRYSDILDFKRWWPEFYKKIATATTSGEKFAISNYGQFVYDLPGYVKTSKYIGGLVSDSFKLLKQNKNSPALPTGRAYTEPIPINSKKINDVKKVMKYVSGEMLEFYYHIISWPTTTKEDDRE